MIIAIIFCMFYATILAKEPELKFKDLSEMNWDDFFERILQESDEDAEKADENEATEKGEENDTAKKAEAALGVQRDADGNIDMSAMLEGDKVWLIAILCFSILIWITVCVVCVKICCCAR